MKILHVVDNYPPTSGGMERAVQALAQAQAALGHDVRVAALATPSLPEFATDGGVRVYRFEGYSRWLRPFLRDPEQQFHPTIADRLLVSRLATLLRDEPADVVHAHGWIVHSAMAIPRDPATALVHTLHDYGLTCATKTMMLDQVPGQICPGPAAGRCFSCSSGFYGTVKGTALAAGALAGARGEGVASIPRIDMLLPISRAVADASLTGVDEGRVRIVPSSVPDAVVHRSASARPVFLPAGEFVLFVGQLGLHKGIDVLLDAHRRMARAVPLVVVGATRPDTPALTGTLERPVHVLADLDHGTIMDCFAAATVCAVPSRWAEPFGLVAVESLAAGTPVVASDIGGLGDIIEHDRTGVLVPPGDASALAAALDGVLADPSKRQKMSDRGRVRASDFTASALMPVLFDAYDAALRARRASLVA